MTPQKLRTLGCTAAILFSSFLLAPPKEAKAFCGFYVSGAGEEMFNNATMVVMMREGTKTVLSMRNNYEGPPEDFAMVIPVPQVLKEGDVKTLKNELFDKVDQLAAPRLVEYWEQDPCAQPIGYGRGFGGLGLRGSGKGGGGMLGAVTGDTGVTVEAEFDVGEYNVAILSAKESTGLETWLKANKYKIPEGAAPVLKPYVEQGLYFFVARVDSKKVKFSAEGQAQLSPLRFAYDSEDFFLPVRLGLLNAKGHQDLIVHILAKNARYEVANYNNVTIPTNLIVKDNVKEQFANFYVSLFDRVLEENPASVITEYSWNSGTCDPCPGPTLDSRDILTLGGDYLESSSPGSGRSGLGFGMGNPWTLTRLHARYTESELTEDLIFKKAGAIVGGRGMPYGTKVIEDGLIGEQRAVPAQINNFQGRYIMLHEWEGKIECKAPVRGTWGANPKMGGMAGASQGVAEDTAFVKRDAVKFADMLITEDVPQLGKVKEMTAKKPSNKGDVATPSADSAAKDPSAQLPLVEKESSGCQVAQGTSRSGDLPWGVLLALSGLVIGGTRRRRRR